MLTELENGELETRLANYKQKTFDEKQALILKAMNLGIDSEKNLTNLTKKELTTRIDEKLIKAVKKVAIDLDCSVNDIIESCLESFLKDPYKENKIKTKKTFKST